MPASTIFANRPSPAATPDFDGFAAANPWVGPKIGRRVLLRGGFSQQFLGATAYGEYGAYPREVHGAIRDRYVQLGGPEGWLGFPKTDETGTPDGKGRFNNFEHGSIYWHPATAAFEVHGAIRDKWAALGYETSPLGYPKSDEMPFTDGRISLFERGAIYWWPDTGAMVLGDVIVQYTGLHCFGETDVDLPSGDDEPVARMGVGTPDGNKRVFNSQIYTDVEGGQDRFDVIELYRGRPTGLAISTLLVEDSGSADVVAGATKLMGEALDKGGAALSAAAARVPGVGPVLGPVASVAVPIIKKVLA